MLCKSRGPRGSRRVTLGRHGKITPAQARKRAAGIIDKIKTGQEPLPAEPEKETGPTVADPCRPLHAGACGGELQTGDGGAL